MKMLWARGWKIQETYKGDARKKKENRLVDFPKLELYDERYAKFFKFLNTGSYFFYLKS